MFLISPFHSGHSVWVVGTVHHFACRHLLVGWSNTAILSRHGVPCPSPAIRPTILTSGQSPPTWNPASNRPAAYTVNNLLMTAPPQGHRVVGRKVTVPRKWMAGMMGIHPTALLQVTKEFAIIVNLHMVMVGTSCTACSTTLTSETFRL